MERAVQTCVENLPENCNALLGRRKQKLQKITLRDHGHLRELVAVDTDDPAHRVRHVADLRDDAPVRIRQHRIRFLRCGAAAALCGALILRTAPDRIGLAAAEKGQLHVCGRFRRGVFAAEHRRVPAAAAGFAVKRIGERVEDGGLACAGVAGDEIQAFSAQLVQGQNRLAGIGTEGRHRQCDRSHASPPQICSINPCR